MSALLGGDRAAPSDRPGTYRDALRNREFRGLILAQVTSVSSRRMRQRHGTITEAWSKNRRSDILYGGEY